MQEREFVDTLIKTIRTAFPNASTLRSSDKFTLGIPDVLAWVPYELLNFPYGICWAIAVEAKSLHPLMPDPFHRGRRIGAMLKHPFTGPQISTLRMLQRSGVEAMGLVRASTDTAFRIPPDKLPADTGNFTHAEMLAIGTPIKRENGLWRFWQGAPHAEVPRSGHRDDPGDGASS